MPEKRLQRVAQPAVQGIIVQRSPLVTQMARGIACEGETIWPIAKRLYRFVWNERFISLDNSGKRCYAYGDLALCCKQGERATEEEILSMCEARLEEWAMPDRVEFRTELPKSMVGKVLRRMLAEEESPNV